MTPVRPIGSDEEGTDRRRHGRTQEGGEATRTSRSEALTGMESTWLIDIDELARWLGTSPRHVRRLVHERRVPFVKIGHFVRFDCADITAWLELQKVSVLDDCPEGGQPPWLGGLLDPSKIGRRRRAPTPAARPQRWIGNRRGSGSGLGDEGDREWRASARNRRAATRLATGTRPAGCAARRSGQGERHKSTSTGPARRWAMGPGGTRPWPRFGSRSTPHGGWKTDPNFARGPASCKGACSASTSNRISVSAGSGR